MIVVIPLLTQFKCFPWGWINSNSLLCCRESKFQDQTKRWVSFLFFFFNNNKAQRNKNDYLNTSIKMCFKEKVRKALPWRTLIPICINMKIAPMRKKKEEENHLHFSHNLWIIGKTLGFSLCCSFLQDTHKDVLINGFCIKTKRNNIKWIIFLICLLREK